MIWTSYFGNKNVINPISIVLITPFGFSGITYPKLYPSNKMLNDFKANKINKNEYTQIYKREILSVLDCRSVYLEITSLFDECTLVCYEHPGKFCHRKLVANWFYENLGVKIQEK